MATNSIWLMLPEPITLKKIDIPNRPRYSLIKSIKFILFTPSLKRMISQFFLKEIVFKQVLSLNCRLLLTLKLLFLLSHHSVFEHFLNPKKTMPVLARPLIVSNA